MSTSFEIFEKEKKWCNKEQENDNKINTLHLPHPYFSDRTWHWKGSNVPMSWGKRNVIKRVKDRGVNHMLKIGNGLWKVKNTKYSALVSTNKGEDETH